MSGICDGGRPISPARSLDELNGTLPKVLQIKYLQAPQGVGAAAPHVLETAVVASVVSGGTRANVQGDKEAAWSDGGHRWGLRA
jgi:hypothetical protein